MTGTTVEGWSSVRLGEIGQSLIGLTYDPSSVSRTGTLVLRSSNVQDGQLSLHDNVYVDCPIPDQIRVRDKDILICVRNGSRRLIGKSVMLDSRVVGQTFGAFMTVFRSNSNSFLQYFFQSDDFKHQIDEHLGATINQITNGSLNSFRVALPGRLEQAEIVGRLRDIDGLIAKLNRLVEKKQYIKQGMMQTLLTGTARLPGFTSQWRSVSAGEVGSFKGGSGFPVRYQGGRSGEFPFFKVSDMNNDGNELLMRTARHHINESVRKRMGAVVMPKNAIVFAKVGAAIFLERKRILSQRSCIDNNMAAFTLDPAQADVRFVHYLLSSFQMSSLVATTAMPSLNGVQLRSIPLSLPADLGEQRAIAAVLGDMDADLEYLDSRLVKAKAIKRGMMQELLTGRTRLPIKESAA